MRYEGFYDRKDLPIQAGDSVKIAKGTLVKNVQTGTKLAGRSYTVKVHHILSGVTISGVAEANPTIVWAGTGGYWSEADINDVEKV